MKKVLLDLLICPRCLPDEQRLQESIAEATGEDIIEGKLSTKSLVRTNQPFTKRNRDK